MIIKHKELKAVSIIKIAVGAPSTLVDDANEDEFWY
jgi:hypothetical protein